MQARYWFDFLPQKNSYADYVRAGCSHTQIIAVEEKSSYDYLSELFLTDNPSLLVRATLSVQCETFLEYIMNKAHSGTVLILEGIRADRYSRAKWKAITADERAVITFDLYYCGIVFFDHARSKQNYTINF